MKKSITLIIFGIFLISSALALTVTQEPLDATVIPEFYQPAKVTLTINDVEPGSYNLYTLTNFKLYPSTPFELKAGSNELKVEIYPTAELFATSPPTYIFQYSIRSLETKRNYDKKMMVRVVSINDALALSSEANENNTDTMTFYIVNREKIDLKNISAKFTSPFFEVEKEFDLGANEKKEFSVAVDKDSISKNGAGTYILKADVETNKGIKTLEGRIFIGERKSIKTTDIKKGLIIQSRTIKKENDGNVPSNVVIIVEKNIISRLLTSFSVEPDIVDRQGLKVVYTWSRDLLPTEVIEVKATTNYVAPLLIIIILLIIIVAFKMLTETKIEVTKSAHPVKAKGNTFALKVNLRVRAKRKIENVSLIDKIPGVVNLYEKFGTIKPTKIDTRNKRIQWDIGDLEAGQEKSFSYIIYSTVGIVGTFTLPEALAVYERNEEIHEAESNRVFFMNEQAIEREEKMQ